MPADEDFDTNLELAGRMDDPRWERYSTYLRLRGQGLRRAGLKVLAAFVSGAEKWPFDERWRFTRTLLERLDGFQTYEAPLPYPLVTAVMRPTLKEAMERFRLDPWPPYWLAMDGMFVWEGAADHPRLRWLMEALKRVPDFQPAVVEAAKYHLAHVRWGQHELPYGYIGIPENDLGELAQAKGLLSRLKPDPDVIELTNALENAGQTARRYLDFRSSGNDSYREWCDLQALPYR